MSVYSYLNTWKMNGEKHTEIADRGQKCLSVEWFKDFPMFYVCVCQCVVCSIQFYCAGLLNKLATDYAFLHPKYVYYKYIIINED